MRIAGILGFAAALAAGPLAAEGRLDTGFGTQGLVVEGFQPDPAGGVAADTDIALAGCSGPQGRLVATGLASNATRVVTMFLRADGSLDPDVGFGGKQSFALPAGRKDNGVGLCQADGKPVLAYNLARGSDPAQPRHVMHVVRIDPATGLPDPGFGTGGTVIVDLDDALMPGNRGAPPRYVTIEQRPLALVAGPNGDLLLMGSYRPNALEEHGFVVRLTAEGGIAATATAADAGSPARRFVGGGTPGGMLRVVGGDGETRTTPGQLIEIEFEYPSLAFVLNTIDPRAPQAVPLAARVLEGNVLAAVVAIDGAPALATAALERPWSVHALPRPRLGGVPADLAYAQLAATADGGVLVMGTLQRDARPQAMYATKLVGTPDGARVDGAFGSGGYTLVLPDAVAAPCQPARVFAFSRFTFWNGAPTAVGVLDRLCSAGDADYDYAVLRLEARLFGDAFEERHPVR